MPKQVLLFLVGVQTTVTELKRLSLGEGGRLIVDGQVVQVFVLCMALANAAPGMVSCALLSLYAGQRRALLSA
jgi:hypothetical protein